MRAFISPFTNAENAYIEMQKVLLEDLGFDVRPLSISAAARGQCLGLFRSQNVVLVHWLENRLFRVGDAKRGLSISGSCSFAVLALLLALSRAKVVYFIHDHAVHDVPPPLRGLSRRAIGWLRALADIRVVHDPSATDQYDAAYLPHPLYWSSSLQPNLSQPQVRSSVPKPRFLILGAIRPYKCIKEVLENWPKGVALHIAGKGSDEYMAELRTVVATRDLGDNVTFAPHFLSDAEFEDTLRSFDVLILPHMQNANLVSGAFFAAIGLVRVVLARRTPFITWAQSQFQGVFAFDEDSALPTVIDEISAQWSSLNTVDSEQAALEHFGPTACLNAYRSVLKNHEDHKPRSRTTLSHGK